MERCDFSVNVPLDYASGLVRVGGYKGNVGIGGTSSGKPQCSVQRLKIYDLKNQKKYPEIPKSLLIRAGNDK